MDPGLAIFLGIAVVFVVLAVIDRRAERATAPVRGERTPLDIEPALKRDREQERWN